MTLPRFAIAIIGLALIASCQLTDPTETTPRADACGASDLTYMVGKRAAEIDVSDTAETVRVIAPDSAVTMDHRPDRLNVHVDDDGVITKLTCG